MKIGLCLPTETGAMGGGDPSALDVLELAKLAEQVGFESIWLVDHFLYDAGAEMAALGAGPPPELMGVLHGAWEVFTLAAGLATATDRVEIGTLVANTGYRNPAVLARMAETIDAMSGGRFICGVGAGDFQSEHDFYGFPWEKRIGRFEEALQIIKPMLRGESVTFDGEFYQTREALLLPKGPRPQGPPIMIGLLKGGPRMKRLVAQYADVWHCWLASTDSHPAAYQEPLDAMLAACEKHGREPASLDRSVTPRVCPTSKRPDGFDMKPIHGSVNEIVDQIGGFEAMGVDHLSVWLWPNNKQGLEAFAPVLEELGR
jgi:alkanesulfonate monooxygenase SsuD/methylene tetrahydromethanopterin reductase-like flavin-dependent oxidoreductase (luciferase family)